MSPRWLYNKGKSEAAKEVLIKIHGKDKAEEESKNIEENISSSSKLSKSNFKDLFSPALRYIMGIGLLLEFFNRQLELMPYIFMQPPFLNKQVLVLMLLFVWGFTKPYDSSVYNSCNVFS